MANNSTKGMSSSDAEQIIRTAFNENDRTIGVSGFVSLKIGHKIEQVATSSTVDTYNYYDNGLLLQTLVVTYTDSTKETLLSVERTA